MVTGSTKEIGRGIAEGLADAGANVAINSRTKEDVTTVTEQLDKSCRLLAVLAIEAVIVALSPFAEAFP
ncbi:hypothetical protein [Haladaptatus sp. CMAA 1911]|uniref:hypothetical protein n=1 Tax=unclassified Haladaptatus TaxID=2622732 RepID=UPI0037547E2C